jgi:hypothetical protein
LAEDLRVVLRFAVLDARRVEPRLAVDALRVDPRFAVLDARRVDVRLALPDDVACESCFWSFSMSLRSVVLSLPLFFCASLTNFESSLYRSRELLLTLRPTSFCSDAIAFCASLSDLSSRVNAAGCLAVERLRAVDLRDADFFAGGIALSSVAVDVSESYFNLAAERH